MWMFCSRKSNNLINKIHERPLRIVTSDKNRNFEDLLKSKKSDYCASKEFASLNERTS